jgi:hypothetical protein
VAFRHGDPGGEWPHTAALRADEVALIDLAQLLDKAAVQDTRSIDA